MAMFFRTILCFFVLISLVFTTSAQNCRSHTFANRIPYSACNDLSVLNSFLHWNYIAENRTVNLAYRHAGVSATRWVAWAINPTARGMVGSQALVAFQSGGRMEAYTSPINSFQTSLARGNLSFPVPTISAEFNGANEITIFATIVLPPGSTTVNQVWQEGPLTGSTPGIHPTTGANIQSIGTIDFQSGQTSSGGGAANSRVKRRNVHGVLNAVSWGTLMPLGAIIARYLKVAKAANPAWFYLHIACQTSAYAVGVAGWATGLKLGSDSPGIQYDSHRNLGIALFVLGTLQVYQFVFQLFCQSQTKFPLYFNQKNQFVWYMDI
ncbi:hypothetical protein AQUCO_00500218v1 [Aquilegia coerulea]|uniref:Cytochrome b561 and DOMON domain-containing protein n=1 Tax=Aquilegia coerulea TaxID=218851 RepID=A0A2G5EQV9_AQUCA|nr:hypothetical protein AQUCO_00500218v1 [Aquilegia coerulea]